MDSWIDHGSWIIYHRDLSHVFGSLTQSGRPENESDYFLYVSFCCLNIVFSPFPENN